MLDLRDPKSVFLLPRVDPRPSNMSNVLPPSRAGGAAVGATAGFAVDLTGIFWMLLGFGAGYYWSQHRMESHHRKAA